MGDLFHEKADRDLFFSSFANDIGTQLDQLKFEFEEIESGVSIQAIITYNTKTKSRDVVSKRTPNYIQRDIV